MCFSFSLEKSSNDLIWFPLAALSSSILYDLLFRSDSALSRALIPSSTLLLTTTNPLSSSSLSDLVLSCIQQYSFNFQISKSFSSSLLLISCQCKFFNLQSSALWDSCSSFSSFSLSCLCNCSCSSMIFFSSGSTPYLISFISLITSFTVSFSFTGSLITYFSLNESCLFARLGGDGWNEMNGFSSSLFCFFISATEVTDLLSSFLRLATDFASSFFREIGGFIPLRPATGGQSSSSSKLLTLKSSFFTSCLAVLHESRVYVLGSGRISIFGSPCCLKKSSKVETSLRVSLCSCSILVLGLSETTGLGRFALPAPRDLLESFLSKDLA